MDKFTAILDIIGINPFVYVPDEILSNIFVKASKSKGFIPVCGAINGRPYTQTLVRYAGEWRLYVNTTMLKDSPKHIGDAILVTIGFDVTPRTIPAPAGFLQALAAHKDAETVFNSLPPSRRHEIVRYLAHLKTEAARSRNIDRAINFLLGKERFIGRDMP